MAKKELSFPYGTEHLSFAIDESRLRGVLKSGLSEYDAPKDPEAEIEEAMKNPIGSPPLSDLAKKAGRVVIIASDHTRPVPSRLLIPPMLREIRKGNPNAEVTILIATGCHRAPTREELTEKFGREIFEREKIVIHDCDDEEQLVHLGWLPSGGELILNRIAVEADLLIAEGFIEPHFFAGYSGGRKSVLPGIAARDTVVSNHCAGFIDDPCARTGILEGNPIHRDMVYAARRCGLKFILNVILDPEKRVIKAVAGDFEKAHMEGVSFLSGLCGVDVEPADCVISTNGGYPLDQNIYQAVKGMTAAEATVKRGGVILMIARSNDGHGAESFYRTFSDEKDLDAMLKRFRGTAPEKTIPDQWQSQIFARVLQRATVLYLSDAPDEMVKDLHMIPVHSIEEGLEKAADLLKKKDYSITAIPDGVSVVVRELGDAE